MRFVINARVVKLPSLSPTRRKPPRRLFPRAPLLPFFTNYFLPFVRKEATRRSPQGDRFLGFLLQFFFS